MSTRNSKASILGYRPLPMHQSSGKLEEYVWESMIWIAVASSQEDIDLTINEVLKGQTRGHQNPPSLCIEIHGGCFGDSFWLAIKAYPGTIDLRYLSKLRPHIRNNFISAPRKIENVVWEGFATFIKKSNFFYNSPYTRSWIAQPQWLKILLKVHRLERRPDIL